MPKGILSGRIFEGILSGGDIVRGDSVCIPEPHAK